MFSIEIGKEQGFPAWVYPLGTRDAARHMH